MTERWTKEREEEFQRLTDLRAKMLSEVWFMGHRFVQMDDLDKEAFTGTNEGTLISYITDDVVLIWDTKNMVLSEMWVDVDGPRQRDWTCTNIL